MPLFTTVETSSLLLILLKLLIRQLPRVFFFGF
jgi:hypothetical protein